MRKRIYSTIAILLITATAVFAGNQKIYNHDSWEYQTTKLLCQLAGIAAPHPVTPVTGAYLENKVASIPESKLPVNARPLLAELKERISRPEGIISNDSFLLNPEIIISPEIYLNMGDTAQRHEWEYGYIDRMKVLDLRMDVAWGDHIYGNLSYPFAIRIHDESFEKTFSQNIFIPGSSEGYQRYTPFEAGISLGNDFFNFYLGRGKLNIGYGYTGNLFIADNFTYQDFAKLSAYSEPFSYDFTYTHFDQQACNKNSQDEYYDDMLDYMTFDAPHQIRLSHTFTTHLWEKFEFSFNEGILMQSPTAVDLRMFNPFVYMHNWNGFESHHDANGDFVQGFWTNSFMSFNFSSNIGWGIRLNFELILDQFQMASEKFESNPYPNAFGALFNISHVYVFEKGILESYAETAYTNPYLYLNNIPSRMFPNYENGEENAFTEKDRLDFVKNQDLILGYKLTYGNDISYSGYKYGPDTIAFALGVNYTDFSDLWSIKGLFMYRAHGMHGIKYTEDTNQDSFSDVTNEENRSRFSLTGPLEHTLLFSVTGAIKPIASLEVFSTLTYQCKLNYNNKTESAPWNNVQWTLGVSFSPTDFLK